MIRDAIVIAQAIITLPLPWMAAALMLGGHPAEGALIYAASWVSAGSCWTWAVTR